MDIEFVYPFPVSSEPCVANERRDFRCTSMSSSYMVSYQGSLLYLTILSEVANASQAPGHISQIACKSLCLGFPLGWLCTGRTCKLLGIMGTQLEISSVFLQPICLPQQFHILFWKPGIEDSISVIYWSKHEPFVVNVARKLQSNI